MAYGNTIGRRCLGWLSGHFYQSPFCTVYNRHFAVFLSFRECVFWYVLYHQLSLPLLPCYNELLLNMVKIIFNNVIHFKPGQAASWLPRMILSSWSIVATLLCGGSNSCCVKIENMSSKSQQEHRPSMHASLEAWSHKTHLQCINSFFVRSLATCIVSDNVNSHVI